MGHRIRKVKQFFQTLTQLQVAIGNSKQALKDAASTMYAIRPNE